jgi:hypothetical protein
VAVINQIEQPMAIAALSWLGAQEGGRRSGPPTAPVYAATCVFPLGDDAEVLPGWPAAGDALSILLEAVEITADGRGTYKVDFLARDLARPLLYPGATVLIMEGPSVVARGVIQEVTDIGDAAS